MKKIAAWVLVATFALVGLAWAADMEGKIQSIDTANNAVVLDNGTTLVCDDGTTIAMEGKASKLEDLNEGATVKVSYEEKDGKNVASRIQAIE